MSRGWSLPVASQAAPVLRTLSCACVTTVRRTWAADRLCAMSIGAPCTREVIKCDTILYSAAGNLLSGRRLDPAGGAPKSGSYLLSQHRCSHESPAASCWVNSAADLRCAARLGVNLGGKHRCFRSCSIADPDSVLVARSWLQVCIYSICKPVTGLTFKIADYADSCKAVHKATVI